MTESLDVVIAGAGRVGARAANVLDDRGHDVTVVERDGDVCTDLSEEYVATIIEGDASRPDILEQASLGDRDVLAALTGQSAQNLAICMVGSDIAPDLRTVARVEEGIGDAYDRFVDGVVYPEAAGAHVAVNEIVGSDVETLADVTGHLDVMRVRVAEGAPAAGRELADITLPTGALVVSDDDGKRVARPETTLTPGKRYVVAVEPEVADEVLNLFRG